jgi:hypothetical protein
MFFLLHVITRIRSDYSVMHLTVGHCVPWNVFDTLTRPWADDLRFQHQQGQEILFLFSKMSRQSLEPSYPHIVKELATLWPEIKQPGHEVDRSLPSGGELKRMSIAITTPILCAFVAYTGKTCHCSKIRLANSMHCNTAVISSSYFICACDPHWMTCFFVTS